MAFSATFYNVTDDPRSLNKTLSGGTTVTSIRPTENCDLLNPKFELDYKANLTTCNYVVVGAPFNRSYFITDLSIDIGKKIYITCAVDVLETYKDDIESLTVNVIRQENLTEPYLPDSEYKIKAGFQNYTQLFSSPHTLTEEGDYVLSWIGGQGSAGAFVAVLVEPADWSTNWGNYYYWDWGTGMTLLSTRYPSATGVPNFEAVKSYLQGIYTYASV